MGAESPGVAAGHFGHDGLTLRRALEAKDRPRELECLLHGPDALVLAGWEDLRRIAYSDPADGHRGADRHGRVHVHDAVDPHFGAGSEAGPVEDARAGANEDRIRHRAAREMRVGTDQDVIADADRVSGCAPQHGLFHDDAVLSNSNGPAFSDEYRAEQHAALSAYGHVAADGGGGRDVGGFVDVRSHTLVFEQHGIPPTLDWRSGACCRFSRRLLEDQPLRSNRSYACAGVS